MATMTRFYLKLMLVFTVFSVLVIGVSTVLGQFRESNRLLFTREYQGHEHIYVYDINTHIIYRLTTGAVDHVGARWSPDGQFIAYFRNTDFSSSELYVMSQDGRNARMLSDNAFRYLNGTPWSPNGEWLLVLAAQEGVGVAAIANVLTGEFRILLVSLRGDASAAWSPDGTHFLLYVLHGDQSDLAITELVSGEIWLVSNDFAFQNNAQWSPDGRYISFLDITEYATNLYVSDVETRTIWLISQDLDGEVSHPVWSTDGQYIAFVNTPLNTRYTSIYVSDVQGNNLQNISPGRTWDRAPVWRANTQLMFVRTTSSLHSEVLWLDIETGESWIVADDAIDHRGLSIGLSPDRRRVRYYTRLYSNITTIEGEFVVNFHNGASSWQWSPDSAFIGYTLSGMPNSTPFFIIHLDSGEEYTIGNIVAYSFQWQPIP